MGLPAPLTKDGGGEHWEHLVRACWTACTMAGRGVACSLLSVWLVPSSHATRMVVLVSDCLTHRVVESLATMAASSVAALPVWHTPPVSSVEVPGTGKGAPPLL